MWPTGCSCNAGCAVNTAPLLEASCYGSVRAGLSDRIEKTVMLRVQHRPRARMLMVRRRTRQQRHCLIRKKRSILAPLPLVDHYPEVNAVAAASTSLDAAAGTTADTRRVVASIVITAWGADGAHAKETVMHCALTLVCEACVAMLEAVAEAAATGSMAATAAGHETMYPCAVSAPGGCCGID